jgi:hypothetical protein
MKPSRILHLRSAGRRYGLKRTACLMAAFLPEPSPELARFER